MSENGTAVVEPPKAPPAKVKPAKPRVDPRNQPRRQPPYAVIVLDDDDHTYAYVIDALCRVFGYTVEKSFKLAQEIDRTGRAIVWSGMLEVAELKRDQIRGRGVDFYAQMPVTYPLGVVLEPLPQ